MSRIDNSLGFLHGMAASSTKAASKLYSIGYATGGVVTSYELRVMSYKL
jgi:hypothetical protein